MKATPHVAFVRLQAVPSLSPGGLTLKRETHNSPDFLHREGFLNHMSSTEELGDTQKILAAGCASDRDHSGVQKFLRQRERDFHPISLRHQYISDNEIG